MEIIPAIDLRGGKCVRLYQGDYRKETVFSEDPVAVALRWRDEGAGRLHLVDLDGAARGEPCNVSVVERIVEVVDIPVQLGGGIRRLDTVEKLLGLGVGRVILGTAAIYQPSLVEEACREFGDAIIVAVDARDGLVEGHGWRQGSDISAVEMVRGMAALGTWRFIYTDIARDGTLAGPNFEAVAELLARTDLPVIAAGGISAVGQLVRLAGLGVEGAILGRALYTGDIDLGEALRAVG